MKIGAHRTAAWAREQVAAGRLAAVHLAELRLRVGAGTPVDGQILIALELLDGFEMVIDPAGPGDASSYARAPQTIGLLFARTSVQSVQVALLTVERVQVI